MAFHCSRCNVIIVPVAGQVCGRCKATEDQKKAPKEDVSAKKDCPLSRLIVKVKTSKGEPVGKADVKVWRGMKQVSRGPTKEDDGTYDTGKTLPRDSYTAKAQHKCHRPKLVEKTDIALGENDEKEVELTLDPYEIKIAAKQASYTVALDKDGNAKPDHPILEFSITDGPPKHLFDVQLSRDTADGLSGGPGLEDAWGKTKKQDERVDKKLFSSWSNGDKALRLDGDGKATYKMPLKWWQDLVPTPFGQSGKADFHYRVLAMDDAGSPPCSKSAPDGGESASKVEVTKEPRTVKIWLLTWNCELMAPSDEQLEDLIVSHFNQCDEKPDLIVVGLQEAGKAGGKFVAERLADKQDPQKSKLKNYRFLDHLAYAGRTKGKCYQDLGVLVRSEVYDKAKDVGKNKKSTRWIGCKGGLIFTMKFDGDINLAFASAHLDAGGKQESDIGKINSQIKELAKKNGFDAVFIMGDLNYRLGEIGEGSLSRSSTNEKLAIMILNPDVRRQLLLKQDLLKNKCSLVTKQNPHFNFPAPDNLFFPTYKVNYKGGNKYKMAPEQRGRLTNNPSYEFFSSPDSIDKAIRTYCWKEDKVPQGFLKKKKKVVVTMRRDEKVIYNKKRKAFDIGWLDRIGWATKWDEVLSARASDPDKKVEISMTDFIGLHKAVLSDHAAVLMKVTVSVK